MSVQPASQRRIYGFIVLPDTDSMDEHSLFEMSLILATYAWGTDSEEGLEEFNSIEVLACADKDMDCDLNYGVVSLVGRPRALLEEHIELYLERDLMRHFETDPQPQDEAPVHEPASVVIGMGGKEYGTAWIRFMTLGLEHNEAGFDRDMRTALEAASPGTTLWVDSLTGNVLHQRTLESLSGPGPL